MKNSAEEWYRSSKMKLPDDDWSPWAESFTTVFGDKGWSKVRYAFSFKFMSGSFVDYALKKERLILEVEKKMTVTTRIKLIVVGLPIEIQDKLDKEEIDSTDVLINLLGRYERKTQQRRESNKDERAQRDHKTNPLESVEKKPCHICDSLKLYNRFHPPERCFNRNKNERANPPQRRNVNINQDYSDDAENSATLKLDNEKN